ncbi:MAG TPA: hypothetical protein VM841_03190 [Actinomycetota bacterium]|nr:hypothetical protein [Actinomycetota bacterium]
MNEVTITPRAAEVLRRGLEAARLDPSAFGVRVWISAGQARSGFADEPDEGDALVDAGGLRVFVDPSVTANGPAAIDVSAEHDQIVVVPAG